ncbi:hypothetical protein CYMTET_31368 [Cymbomonas tetramitiformis]|uniref:Uncharacterized protein n=1 Tax=Cymbomonas tetramitiformis TaxID=36881 RepID=A0AAE0KT78_9CHLO|nr:hypothetical protein CYMTET_31368 [Cymbomonas tetramitiformis]
MDQQTREVAVAMKHIENELLNLRCPHCTRVFKDWLGCAAVCCSHDRGGCKGYFCGWCLKPCRGQKDAHDHAGACRQTPTGDKVGLFPSDQTIMIAQEMLKRKRVDKYLQSLSSDIRQELEPKIARHFSK